MCFHLATIYKLINFVCIYVYIYIYTYISNDVCISQFHFSAGYDLLQPPTSSGSRQVDPWCPCGGPRVSSHEGFEPGAVGEVSMKLVASPG